jgi:hypothetical protein
MGGKSKPASAQTSTSGNPVVLDQINNSLIPGIEDYSENYGNGEGLYSGSILADQDPLIRQAQGQALGQRDTVSGLSDSANTAFQGFLDYDPNSATNQMARDAFGAEVRSQFDETIRPGIEDIGTSSGQFGGNQQNLALGSASAPLSRAIASNEARLAEGDRGRAFDALRLTGQMQDNSLLSSQITGDVGQQRTVRGQQELTDDIQMGEAERRNQLQSLLEQSGLLGPLANSSTSTTTGGTAASGGTAGVAKGALGGAAAGGAIAGPWGAAVGGVLGGLGAL